MIGMWSEYSQTYLLVFVVVTSTVFALPLFFKPLLWAKLMMWEIPEETDLTVYFGRCLGAFICIVELISLRAALTGEGVVFAFEVMLAVFYSCSLYTFMVRLKRSNRLQKPLRIYCG